MFSNGIMFKLSIVKNGKQFQKVKMRKKHTHYIYICIHVCMFIWQLYMHVYVYHTQTHSHTQRQDVDKVRLTYSWVCKVKYAKFKLSNKGKFFEFKNLKSSTTTLNFMSGYPHFFPL
jgi:hypothetical protein